MDLCELIGAKQYLDVLGMRLTLIESALKIGRRALNRASGDDPGGMLSRSIAELEERERALIEKGAACERGIITAEEAVRRLPEPQRSILWCRYVDGLQWVEVARMVNYSEKHCMRLGEGATSSV